MVIWVVLRKASGVAVRYALKTAATYAFKEAAKKVAVVGAQAAIEHFRRKKGFSEAPCVEQDEASPQEKDSPQGSSTSSNRG